MRAVVNKRTCNGCTICNITCPEVFKIEEDGKAGTSLAVIPRNIEQICIEAADECPASSIMIIGQDSADRVRSFARGELQVQGAR